MGFLSWLTGAESTSPEWRPLKSPLTSGSTEPIHLARGNDYTFEVVGESHRQEVLNEICGGKCEDGYDLGVTAQLVLIEGNPHDPNAVGVFINSQLVAYIPRHLAPGVRADISRLSPDERPVTCDAKIVGGWERGDGDEGHYGLKLSLSDPLRVAE